MADPITLGALALSAAGTAISASGTIAGGNAAAQAGQFAQQGMQFRAAQERQAADESRAVGQRGAIEQRHQGALALSKLQARAAASGGGADDPTVLALGGQIAKRSEYDALFDIYKGENRARGLMDTATGDELTGAAELAGGKAKQSAAQLSAIGTIVGGAGSMYRTYNKIPDVRYG